MGSLKILQYNNSGSLKKSSAVPNLLGVLQQSSDPNHSPLGSPPTEKKRVRRFSNSLAASGHVDNKENSLTSSEHRPIASTQQRQSFRSILKKSAPAATATVRQSTTSVLSSALAPRSRCSHNRSVNFNSNVTVKYIDGPDTCCYEPLREHDRQNFLARNALRRLQASLQYNSPAQSSQVANYYTGSQSSPPPAIMTPQCHPQQTVIQSYIREPTTSSTTTPNSTSTSTTLTGSNQSPLMRKNVDITFTQQAHGTGMRFVVFMGPQYDPSNIVVKANMSGTRLRVVASLKGEKAAEHYNERFQLPMSVDPYKVEARLDARGYLTVTAPLLERDTTVSA